MKPCNNTGERAPSSDSFARIDFDGFFETDGVAFLKRRTKSVLEKTKEEEIKELQENLKKSEQIYGLDLGLNLVIGLCS